MGDLTEQLVKDESGDVYLMYEDCIYSLCVGSRH